jgi:hypothetical protein
LKLIKVTSCSWISHLSGMVFTFSTGVLVSLHFLLDCNFVKRYSSSRICKVNFTQKMEFVDLKLEGKVMQCADCTRLLANNTKGLGKIHECC